LTHNHLMNLNAQLVFKIEKTFSNRCDDSSEMRLIISIVPFCVKKICTITKENVQYA